MAQLAEQLICNQQVIGSSPIIGFTAQAVDNLKDIVPVPLATVGLESTGS